jgi:hypothetical protein
MDSLKSRLDMKIIKLQKPTKMVIKTIIKNNFSTTTYFYVVL